MIIVFYSNALMNNIAYYEKVTFDSITLNRVVSIVTIILLCLFFISSILLYFLYNNKISNVIFIAFLIILFLLLVALCVNMALLLAPNRWDRDQLEIKKTLENYKKNKNETFKKYKNIINQKDPRLLEEQLEIANQVSNDIKKLDMLLSPHKLSEVDKKLIEMSKENLSNFEADDSLNSGPGVEDLVILAQKVSQQEKNMLHNGENNRSLYHRIKSNKQYDNIITNYISYDERSLPIVPLCFFYKLSNCIISIPNGLLELDGDWPYTYDYKHGIIKHYMDKDYIISYVVDKNSVGTIIISKKSSNSVVVIYILPHQQLSLQNRIVSITKARKEGNIWRYYKYLSQPKKDLLKLDEAGSLDELQHLSIGGKDNQLSITHQKEDITINHNHDHNNSSVGFKNDDIIKSFSLID